MTIFLPRRLSDILLRHIPRRLMNRQLLGRRTNVAFAIAAGSWVEPGALSANRELASNLRSALWRVPYLAGGLSEISALWWHKAVPLRSGTCIYAINYDALVVADPKTLIHVDTLLSGYHRKGHFTPDFCINFALDHQEAWWLLTTRQSHLSLESLRVSGEYWNPWVSVTSGRLEHGEYVGPFSGWRIALPSNEIQPLGRNHEQFIPHHKQLQEIVNTACNSGESLATCHDTLASGQRWSGDLTLNEFAAALILDILLAADGEFLPIQQILEDLECVDWA